MKNKTRTYGQRVRGLRELIQDAKRLGFSGDVVEGYKQQLRTAEGYAHAEQGRMIVSR